MICIILLNVDFRDYMKIIKGGGEVRNGDLGLSLVLREHGYFYLIFFW